MIVVDANLLIYAYDEDSPFHARSASWLQSVFDNTEPIGLPVLVVMAFIRITTNRGLRGAHFELPEAIEIVDQWLSLPHVRLLAMRASQWPVLRDQLLSSSAGGKFTSDVQIAVLAMEQGATLYSADHDFARFPTLIWVNPLRLS